MRFRNSSVRLWIGVILLSSAWLACYAYPDGRAYAAPGRLQEGEEASSLDSKPSDDFTVDLGREIAQAAVHEAKRQIDENAERPKRHSSHKSGSSSHTSSFKKSSCDKVPSTTPSPPPPSTTTPAPVVPTPVPYVIPPPCTDVQQHHTSKKKKSQPFTDAISELQNLLNHLGTACNNIRDNFSMGPPSKSLALQNPSIIKSAPTLIKTLLENPDQIVHIPEILEASVPTEEISGTVEKLHGSFKKIFGMMEEADSEDCQEEDESHEAQSRPGGCKKKRYRRINENLDRWNSKRSRNSGKNHSGRESKSSGKRPSNNCNSNLPKTIILNIPSGALPTTYTPPTSTNATLPAITTITDADSSLQPESSLQLQIQMQPQPHYLSQPQSLPKPDPQPLQQLIPQQLLPLRAQQQFSPQPQLPILQQPIVQLQSSPWPQFLLQPQPMPSLDQSSSARQQLVPQQSVSPQQQFSSHPQVSLQQQPAIQSQSWSQPQPMPLPNQQSLPQQQLIAQQQPSVSVQQQPAAQLQSSPWPQSQYFTQPEPQTYSQEQSQQPQALPPQYLQPQFVSQSQISVQPQSTLQVQSLTQPQSHPQQQLIPQEQSALQSQSWPQQQVAPQPLQPVLQSQPLLQLSISPPQQPPLVSSQSQFLSASPQQYYSGSSLLESYPQTSLTSYNTSPALSSAPSPLLQTLSYTVPSPHLTTQLVQPQTPVQSQTVYQSQPLPSTPATQRSNNLAPAQALPEAPTTQPCTCQQQSCNCHKQAQSRPCSCQAQGQLQPCSCQKQVQRQPCSFQVQTHSQPCNCQTSTQQLSLTPALQHCSCESAVQSSPSVLIHPPAPEQLPVPSPTGQDSASTPFQQQQQQLQQHLQQQLQHHLQQLQQQLQNRIAARGNSKFNKFRFRRHITEQSFGGNPTALPFNHAGRIFSYEPQRGTAFRLSPAQHTTQYSQSSLPMAPSNNIIAQASFPNALQQLENPISQMTILPSNTASRNSFSRLSHITPGHQLQQNQHLYTQLGNANSPASSQTNPAFSGQSQAPLNQLGFNPVNGAAVEVPTHINFNPGSISDLSSNNPNSRVAWPSSQGQSSVHNNQVQTPNQIPTRMYVNDRTNKVQASHPLSSFYLIQNTEQRVEDSTRNTPATPNPYYQASYPSNDAYASQNGEHAVRVTPQNVSPLSHSHYQAQYSQNASPASNPDYQSPHPSRGAYPNPHVERAVQDSTRGISSSPSPHQEASHTQNHWPAPNPYYQAPRPSNNAHPNSHIEHAVQESTRGISPSPSPHQEAPHTQNGWRAPNPHYQAPPPSNSAHPISSIEHTVEDSSEDISLPPNPHQKAPRNQNVTPMLQPSHQAASPSGDIHSVESLLQTTEDYTENDSSSPHPHSQATYPSENVYPAQNVDNIVDDWSRKISSKPTTDQLDYSRLPSGNRQTGADYWSQNRNWPTSPFNQEQNTLHRNQAQIQELKHTETYDGNTYNNIQTSNNANYIREPTQTFSPLSDETIAKLKALSSTDSEDDESLLGKHENTAGTVIEAIADASSMLTPDSEDDELPPGKLGNTAGSSVEALTDATSLLSPDSQYGESPLEKLGYTAGSLIGARSDASSLLTTDSEDGESPKHPKKPVSSSTSSSPNSESALENLASIAEALSDATLLLIPPTSNNESPSKRLENAVGFILDALSGLPSTSPTPSSGPSKPNPNYISKQPQNPLATEERRSPLEIIANSLSRTAELLNSRAQQRQLNQANNQPNPQVGQNTNGLPSALNNPSQNAESPAFSIANSLSSMYNSTASVANTLSSSVSQLALQNQPTSQNIMTTPTARLPVSPKFAINRTPSQPNLQSNSEISLILSRDQVSRALNGGTVLPGDIITIALNDQSTLVGKVVDFANPISFTRVRNNNNVPAQTQGNQIWNVLSSGRKNQQLQS